MKNIIGIVLLILAVGLAYYVIKINPDGDRISVTEADTGTKPDSSAQAETPAGESKQGQLIDPHANFSHFRVGPRTVKDILADGDIMWVGTSGGVIRYDTTDDTYKLFDVKSGLLANGIFHLSKLDDRLLVGTYGGGMYLQKKNEGGWNMYNIAEGLADASGAWAEFAGRPR